MEFPFDVNYLFGDEITVVDSHLMPSRRKPSLSLAECKEQIRRVLDAMGAASTKAQGLYTIITSGRKLETSLNQRCYVMKDAEGNNGRGLILGILKVGQRTLFVYDHNGQQHEMVPLCVLDFYVHESRQRMGCGKRLFDYMLQQEEVQPQHLAIDTPSSKFVPFLKKHYHFKATIQQVNKFVVFEGFFTNRHDVVRQQGRIVSRPPKHPSSAKARPNGQPTYPNEIKQQREKEALSHISLPRSRSRDALNAIGVTLPLPQEPRARPPLPSDRGNMTPLGDDDFGDNNASRGRGAQAHMYSRHAMNSTPTRIGSAGSTRETPIEPLYMYKKEPLPPVPPMPRDGPSTDYKEFHQHLNSHQAIQDRRGHLKTGTDRASPLGMNSSPTHVRSDTNKPLGDHYATRSAKPMTLNSNWTVYGVPPNYQGRKWQHTQLW
ncbi:alpha-tubulin N-acetyltransferase 1-like isoform X1 [Lineus longissimus]|uniref:alpha-tubulin N-acetyltransferase 1-like isoform X1 n=1 Tax=Lineus longissimus TaxID=88925 RepID=UPI002B4F77B1